MVSKRLSIYGFISAATVVSGLLTGCGGSSASVPPPVAPVKTQGGLGNAPTNLSGQITGGTAGSTTPITVTVNGQQVQVILPPGETMPANGIVALINPGTTPVLGGLSVGPKTLGEKGAPSIVKGKAMGGSPGQVYLDGHFTGSTITGDGLLDTPFLIVPGAHLLQIYGQLSITDTNTGKTLTVQEIDFNMKVNSDGNSAIPSLTCGLPANGETINGGAYATVTFPTPSFSTGSTTLSIQYGGVTITKGKSLKEGSATYTAFGSHPAIPNPGGIDLITFTYK